ncbi:Mitochondrial import inner membrane translocase subunit Tim29 [Lemmus lemmus]
MVAAKPEMWVRLGTWAHTLLQDESVWRRRGSGSARPGRAALYMGLLDGTAACCALASSETAFEEALLDASGSLLVLAPTTRNHHSEAFLQRLLWLRGSGRLRHVNLGLCSLVYEAPFDAQASLYQAHCRYLQPCWIDFPSRVFNVGYWAVGGSWRTACVIATSTRQVSPPACTPLRRWAPPAAL